MSSRAQLTGAGAAGGDNLPGPGNYHTNMVAFAPDGKLYFSQGALSNTGIIRARRLRAGMTAPGHLFVALFGDEVTAPSGPRVGRSVVRVDPLDWSLHPFVGDGLQRPIDVRFSPSGSALYVLDFGSFEMLAGGGVSAEARSGKLWRFKVSNEQ